MNAASAAPLLVSAIERDRGVDATLTFAKLPRVLAKVEAAHPPGVSSHSTAAWLTWLLVAASGCGGRTAIDAETRSPKDSGVDTIDASEAGVLSPIDAALDSVIACGPMECAQGAICVTTLEGSGPCLPPASDGGVCPFGNVSFRGCCEYAAYACQVAPVECVPSKVCGCTQLCPVGSCDGGVPVSPQFTCNEIGT